MKRVGVWWCKHPGASGVGVVLLVCPCIMCVFPVGVIVLVIGCAVVCGVGFGQFVIPCLLCAFPVGGILFVAGWGALGG